MMHHFTTNRLQLRPFTPEDGADLFEYLSDPEVVQYEPYLPYETKEQAEEEAARRAQSPDFWAVCLLDGKLIGNVYLAKGDFDTWEIGYVFNRRYWGQGYATESSRALLSYIFAECGAHRVVAFCDPCNANSWKVLERLNLRREGHLLQNVYFFCDEQGNPLWKDSYEYGILKEEW